MPDTDNLSDEQWCVLDLLMRARQKGVDRLNRMELLRSSSLPDRVKARLTMAALIMPKHLVQWIGEHDFKITEAGIEIYNLRFDDPAPTPVADAVIALPDMSRERLQ